MDLKPIHALLERSQRLRTEFEYECEKFRCLQEWCGSLFPKINSLQYRYKMALESANRRVDLCKAIARREEQRLPSAPGEKTRETPLIHQPSWLRDIN